MEVMFGSPTLFQETFSWSILLSLDFALQIRIPFFVNIDAGAGASSFENTSFTLMYLIHIDESVPR